MSRFIFTNIDESGDKITHEISAVHIHKVMDGFESFLRGCGFVFDGQLEIVDNIFDEGLSVTSGVNDLSDYNISINLDDYPIFQDDLNTPQSPVTNDLIKTQDC